MRARAAQEREGEAAGSAVDEDAEQDSEPVVRKKPAPSQAQAQAPVKRAAAEGGVKKENKPVAPAISQGTKGTTAGGSGAPSFLAPTKAYQTQCMPAKTVPQVVFTDEDLVRQEAEKREKVAAIRRKFKEQHKKILDALKRRNEEDSKKVSTMAFWRMLFVMRCGSQGRVSDSGPPLC